MVESYSDCGTPTLFLLNTRNCEGCGKRDVYTRVVGVRGYPILLWVCEDCYLKLKKLGAKDVKRL